MWVQVINITKNIVHVMLYYIFIMEVDNCMYVNAKKRKYNSKMVDNGIYRKINYKTFFQYVLNINKHIFNYTLQFNVNIKFLTFSFYEMYLHVYSKFLFLQQRN